MCDGGADTVFAPIRVEKVTETKNGVVRHIEVLGMLRENVCPMWAGVPLSPKACAMLQYAMSQTPIAWFTSRSCAEFTLSRPRY